MKRGNQYYSLEVDVPKNRIYFSINGYTPSVKEIPYFEQDWKETVKEVKSGFTILGDLMTMQPHPPDVEELNKKVQAWLMSKGCRKVAQLAPMEARIQVNKFSEESGLGEVLRAFHLKKNAEIWLNMK